MLPHLVSLHMEQQKFVLYTREIYFRLAYNFKLNKYPQQKNPPKNKKTSAAKF